MYEEMTIDNEYAQERLKYWQKRLYLDDWTIKLVVNCTPEEMEIDGAAGCTNWSETIKAARVQILDPQYYGNRLIPFNFEKTLLHELLHLKFTFWCQYDDISDRLMHQIIDELARAFAVSVAKMEDEE